MADERVVERTVEREPHTTVIERRGSGAGVVIGILVLRDSPRGRRLHQVYACLALGVIMLGTSAIRNLIREDKVAQMYSAIQTGGSLGMQTLDMCLKDLVTKGLISREHAREKARTPDNF